VMPGDPDTDPDIDPGSDSEIEQIAAAA
jgi:hypothetical protein